MFFCHIIHVNILNELTMIGKRFLKKKNDVNIILELLELVIESIVNALIKDLIPENAVEVNITHIKDDERNIKITSADKELMEGLK